MGAIHLDPRLSAAANYVTRGGVAADIGTDHAYLPCFLVKNGISRRAFACDIAKGPLSKARQTVLQSDLSDKVELILCDGLCGLADKSEEITDIIIAGMGGEMICKILGDSDFAKNSRFNFIFQPMTKEHILRRFLCENGWRIVDETACVAARKHYTVMNVRYVGGRLPCKGAYLYAGELLNKNDSAARGYKQMIADRLKKAGEGKLNSPETADEARRLLECAAKLVR
ncbi:MAG: class I SAM-dependent methyltransferase [Acutalibacteraceae bacterium]